jgi:hypothetical protein
MLCRFCRPSINQPRDTAIEALGQRDTQFELRHIFSNQRCELHTFAVAQPHNLFLYYNFLRSHDRLRRSGRDETESSNPFKLVEANH